jgi:hypothetical protein
MAPLFRYSDPGGIEEPATLVSLPSNVRWGDFALTNSAAVGDPANSTIMLDDQQGLLDLQGLRAFDVRELSAPSNNRVIFRGVVQDRVVKRGVDRSALVGTARMWTVDLTDYNWHLTKRLLVDQDSDRPAESIGDRLRWLINRAAHVNINDYGNVTYPSRQMEANDYRLQRPMDVLNDCCIEDNYNFWVDYNEAHGKPELFFINPLSSTYASSLYISNDIDDVDSVTVFAPYREAELVRSASRIAFGAAVSYPDGFEYRRKDSTGAQFGKLDQVAPMDNVKSAARAGRLAQKFVNDNDEETDVITCAIKVPRAQVNDIRHGHLLPVKFTHLPGYETFQWVRVLERTVVQEPEGGDTHYLIDLKLTAPSGPSDPAEGPPDPPFQGDAIAALIGWSGDGNPANYVWQEFQWTGDAPGAGYSALLTSGPLTPTAGVAAVLGITADAAMTVRVCGEVFVTGVVSAFEEITLNIRVNGSVVASHTESITPPGAMSWNPHLIVDTGGIALALGDEVTMDTRVANDGFLASVGDNASVKNSSMLIVGRGTHTNIPSGSTFYYGGTPWVGP